MPAMAHRNPGATAEWGKEGAEGEQLFDSDYPLENRGGVRFTTGSLQQVGTLSLSSVWGWGRGWGVLTLTQSLLTN